MHLRRLIALITIVFFAAIPVNSPARFFTDPSIPLTQIEADTEEPVSDIQEEKKEEPREEQKEKRREAREKSEKRQAAPAQKRKNPQLGLKIGYNFKPTIEEDDLGEIYDDSKDRVSFDLAMDLVINPFKHLGLGIGVALMADAFDDISGNRHFLGLVPVYGIIKLYLLEGTTPYAVFNIGYNAATLYNVDATSTGETYDISGEKGGLHYSIGGGILLGMGFQIEVAYSVTRGGYALTTDFGGPYDISFAHSRVTVSLAYFF